MKLFLHTACVAAFLGLAPSLSAKELVILHTNDTHSQIDPFKEDDLGGVSRRKVLIDSVKTAHDNVLLIDAGDVVQGSLFFNLYKGEVEEKLINALGYDIRIMGNHEFDNGMQALADNYATAQAELLCSNYDVRNTPLKNAFKQYTIREIDGKRIAFMPINLQPAGMISKRNTVGMGYVNDIETANHMAWYLKNIEHADAVVAITHVGYAEDVDIISQSKDIDLLIGGHSHTTVNPANPSGPAYKVPNAEGREIIIAQAGKGGKYLGEITIDLDSLGTAVPKSKLIKVDSRLDSRVDPAIEEIIAPYRAEVDALYDKKVAKAVRRLDKSSNDLLNFASDFVMMRGNQLADGIDLSIMNKGGLRNSIEKGPVSEGEIITLMPFFNNIQVLDVDGSDLLAVFNIMAAQDGNGVSSNVRATYDPETNECIEIAISGKPIDPSRKYRVATINYLAEGGDYMTPLTHGTLVAESSKYLFEDILDYFHKTKNKKIDPQSEQRFIPVKK